MTKKNLVGRTTLETHVLSLKRHTKECKGNGELFCTLWRGIGNGKTILRGLCIINYQLPITNYQKTDSDAQERLVAVEGVGCRLKLT
jgi:hypothetical protein